MASFREKDLENLIVSKKDSYFDLDNSWIRLEGKKSYIKDEDLTIGKPDIVFISKKLKRIIIIEVQLDSLDLNHLGRTILYKSLYSENYPSYEIMAYVAANKISTRIKDESKKNNINFLELNKKEAIQEFMQINNQEFPSFYESGLNPNKKADIKKWLKANSKTNLPPLTPIIEIEAFLDGGYSYKIKWSPLENMKAGTISSIDRIFKLIHYAPLYILLDENINYPWQVYNFMEHDYSKGIKKFLKHFPSYYKTGSQPPSFDEIQNGIQKDLNELKDIKLKRYCDSLKDFKEIPLIPKYDIMNSFNDHENLIKSILGMTQGELEKYPALILSRDFDSGDCVIDDFSSKMELFAFPNKNSYQIPLTKQIIKDIDFLISSSKHFQFTRTVLL